MKIKQLFSALLDNRIMLHSVLIFVVFSILICACCLVGTTQAWMTVKVDNLGNELQIAKPSVTFYVDNSIYVSAVENLSSGRHVIRIEHANDGDAFNMKSTLFVTISIDNEIVGYVELNRNNNYMAEFSLVTSQPCSITWSVAWGVPEVGSELDLKNGIQIGEPIQSKEPEVFLYSGDLGYASQSILSGGTYTVCVNTALFSENPGLEREIY